MDWPRLLAYTTGTVGQELLLRNEYLAAENRILKNRRKARPLPSEPDKRTLAEIGHRLGRKALADVANAARPDTIMGRFRKLVAQKFGGSKARRKAGRPQLRPEVEQLIVRMVKENLGWGYDKIAGVVANLGHTVSDQTIGNVLKRHDIPPAPERKRTTTWAQFIRRHMAVLGATDFFQRRGAHTARIGHLLRAVFYSPGKPQDQDWPHHPHPHEVWMCDTKSPVEVVLTKGGNHPCHRMSLGA